MARRQSQGRRRSAEGLVAEPEDTLYAVYVIFTVMGTCMLFPWNAFITASSYFYVRFRGSPYASNFEDLFAVIFLTANTVVLALFTIFPQTQRWMLLKGTYGPIWRESVRILFPLVLNAILFGTTAFLIKTDSLSPVHLFYVISGMLVLAGSATALLQGGVYGLAGRFPPVYTQALMGGQGLAGLSVSVTAACTTWLRPPKHVVPEIEDVRGPAFVYFVVAVGVVGVGILGFGVLALLPYAHYYAKKNARRSRGNSADLGQLVAGGQPSEALEATAAQLERRNGGLVASGRPRSSSRPVDMNASLAHPRVAGLRGSESMRSDISDASMGSQAELSTSAAVERDSFWLGGRFMRFVRSASSRKKRARTPLKPRDEEDLETALLGGRGGDDGASESGGASNMSCPSTPRAGAMDSAGGSAEWHFGEDGEVRLPTIAQSPGSPQRHLRRWPWQREAADDSVGSSTIGSDSVRRARLRASTAGAGWGKAVDVSPSADTALLVLMPNGARTRAIVRTVLPSAVSALGVFLVTLSVFPGITASIGTQQTTIDPRITGDLFTPIIFILFNLGDTAGRMFAGVWPKKVPSDWLMSCITALRVLFIPVFLLCAVDTAGGGEGGVLPVVFKHPIYPVIFTALLSFSNGHVASIVMMHAPQRVAPPLRDEAGGLMALFLTSGLCLGSYSALALRALVCNCNPLS